jgi:hypothetical protein
LKLSKPQISQQHPSRICFVTPGWHVTRDFNLLSFTMREGANSNVSSNKCVYKTIMALRPNQLQITTYHPQANAIIERLPKVVSDMLKSFDLENNHENLEEDNSFDYFLQLTAWFQAIRSTYRTILQATPCQLVFGRDMIHNIAFRSNWD